MKQVFLSPAGQIKFKDIDEPICKDGGILVKTEYSLISAGTELTVISQFRQKPGTGDEIPLGYSNAGVVISVGKNAKSGIRVGDKVACAGGGHAGHGEICYVPNNLFVKLPEKVSTRDATFNALGAIAMHGFRRGQPTLGDWTAVIGLGMVGLFTVQYAKLAGLKTIAVDFVQERLDIAKSLGADYCINGKDTESIKKVLEITGGRGVDLCIICAGSPNSSRPLCDAMEMCRDKGRVVMVGNIKLDFPRDTMYNKEVDLLISRSYGPGRYDSSYEEDGYDYPYGYVRWTENRNMEEFIRLLSQGKVSVESLITSINPFNRCEEVYENALNSAEKPIAILFKY